MMEYCLFLDFKDVILKNIKSEKHIPSFVQVYYSLGKVMFLFLKKTADK